MVRATSSSNKPKAGLIEYLRSIASGGKHNQPLQKHALEERLDYRDSLVEQLASKQTEASQISDQLGRQRGELQSARNVVDGLSLRVSHEESGLGDFRGADSKHQLDAAQAELNRVIASIEADEERLDSLRGEIESLQREIQSISHGAAADDVKVYLSTLNKQRAQVAQLEELIRDVEANSSPDSIDAEELNAFQQAREELLADIAAGTAKPEELEALDAKAEGFLSDSAGRQAEAQNAARNHQQTLAGLTRRLSVAQERYAELAGRTPQVIEQLLIARAASVYKEYQAAAQVLITSFHQLQGLQEVLANAVPQSKARLLSPRWSGLFIPSASESVAPDQGAGFLYSGQDACQVSVLQEAHRQALAGLENEGLADLLTQDCKA